MQISLVDGIRTVQINMYQLAFLGVIAYYIGVWARKKYNFFVRASIPGPVIGGLPFAILVAALEYNGIANIKFDGTLQTFFMLTFFCTLGMSASLNLLKKGTKFILMFLLICSIGAVIQNFLGIGISSMFGIDPRYGIIAGSMSLTGGLATVGAFAPIFESRGLDGAVAAGIACATFGIISGALVGGPVADFMIRRHKCKTPLDPNYEEILFETSLTEDNVEAIHPDTYFKTVAWLLLAVGLGSLISFYIEAFFRSRGSNQTFPINLGGVIAAMLIRNIGDGTGKWKIDTKANDNISDICLAFFISMAIVSMKLAELIDLALPLITMLFAQLIITSILAYLTVFFIFGRNYESSLLSAGYVGIMMGATYNAFVAMGAVTGKYGNKGSTRAYLIISLTGVFTLDIVNAFLINFMGNSTALLSIFM